MAGMARSRSASGATINAPGVEGALDPSRPQMRHTSLADLAQDDTKVDISNKEKISKEIEGEGKSTDKLEKLKRIKGGK